MFLALPLTGSSATMKSFNFFLRKPERCHVMCVMNRYFLQWGPGHGPPSDTQDVPFKDGLFITSKKMLVKNWKGLQMEGQTLSSDNRH